MRSSSACLSASLLLAGAVFAQEEAAPPRPKNAEALFAAFAKLPGLAARYTEKKHLSLLAVPLESRGRLYFMQPGYLSRVVEAPEKSTLTITPDELRMAGRDGVEVIDLHQSDRLRLFVTSLVRVFRGERESLARHYGIAYVPDAEDDSSWTLELKPREKSLAQMMRSLTLRGAGAAVTEITVVEPNGDRTVTKIFDAEPKRQFTAEEKAEIFGIRAKKAP